MKLLQICSKQIFLAIMVIGLTVSSIAKELPSTQAQNMTKSIVPMAEYYNIKNVNNSQLELQFRKLDSLANAYSYFTNDQQPFVYSNSTKELITIKRGFNVASASSNTLNDLYIITSSDWGLTWGTPVEVYSASTYPGSNARYPSVYGFTYDGKPAYVYTSPVTDGNGWKGFINGLLYDGTPIPTVQNTFVISSQAYGWGGTDSKIVGGVVGSDPYGLAVGGLMPPGGDFSITSNIGQRFTTTFEDWTPSIPTEWAANKFVKPYAIQTYTDSLRNSSIVALKKTETNNKLYFACYGRFLASEDTSQWVPAVSKSTDNGTTWDAFEIFPSSLIEQYAISKNVNPAAVNIGSQDFVVLDNGDYSFLVTMNEDTTMTGTLYADALHDIVELYKEGSNYGVRFVAKTTGYSLAYIGNTTSNQMGLELMGSRTVDGEYIMAKWVDFIDVEDQNGQVYKNYTTDIMAAMRSVSSNKWGTPKNLTESLDYDRITWISDYIPNDLKNIPVLKLISIPNSADTDDEARQRQRSLENDQQYVLIANFDGDVLLSKEEEQLASTLSIEKVYPNPASDKVLVEMTIPTSGEVNFTLTDLFGRKLSSLLSQQTGSGYSAFEINLGDKPSGAYFMKVDFNGSSVTKLINIIK